MEKDETEAKKEQFIPQPQPGQDLNPKPDARLVHKPFSKPILSVVFIALFAVTGVYVVLRSHAATDATNALTPSFTVQANATSTAQSALTWTTPTTAGVVKYNLFRNGTVVDTTNPTNDQYTTNIIDSGLTPSTSYIYQVKAVNAAGTPVAISNKLTVQTGATTTAITGCNFNTTTLGSGNYVLNADITTNVSNATGPCLDFANASNVTLNCQGHTISDSAIPNAQLFKFDTVNHFLLDNCKSANFTDPVDVENGSFGTIASNSFMGPTFKFDQESHTGFYLGSSTNMVVKKNTIANVAYTASFASGTFNSTAPLSGSNYFGFNTMDDTGAYGVNFYIVYVDGGNNNVVDSNTLKGNSLLPVPCYCSGTDDGVILDNNSDFHAPTPDSAETGDIVVNNTITGTYDTGVETVGLIQNTLIAGNNVSNGEQAAAVGAFYSTSWKNVQVANNTAGPLTEYLFYIDIQIPIGGIGYQLPIGQSKFYFQDNQFTGNTYAQQSANPLTSLTSYFNLAALGSGAPPMVAQNDTFTNNNLGIQNLTPIWYPRGMIVDGGGNVCRLPTGTSPTYPLKCASSPTPTSGTATAPTNPPNTTPAPRHPLLPPR